MQTVEDQLKKTHYLLGDEFSAADIVCGHVLMVADVTSPSCSAALTAAQKYLRHQELQLVDVSIVSVQHPAALKQPHCTG